MKKVITIFAVAAALVACEKSEVRNASVPDPSRPVEFSVQNLYSFVATKADPIANGKQVGVYAGAPISKDNVSFNVSMTDATSGALAPATTNSLLWSLGQTTQETKFLAVYPYESVRPLAGETEDAKYIDYTIASEGDVAYAEVFLAASASQAPGNGESPAKVALAFKHPFVKLVYNIDNQSDDYVAAVKISGIRRTGKIMFKDGKVETTGEAVAADAAVALNENGENSYMTVVMPESGAVNPSVKLEMVSGAVYTYALTAGVALEAGKVYTAAIQLTGSHGTEQSDRTVLGTFTVTDWENVDSGNLSGAVTTAANKWWYLEGNIDEVSGTSDGNWDKHLPFKCVGVNTWAVDFYYAGDADIDHGFKIRYAEDASDWSEAYGKDVVIASEYVKAEGDGDGYLVVGASTSGSNMRIDAVGKYRIKWYTDTHNFHIYKID